MVSNRKAICLFSSAGIGELGIKQNNIDIVISNELLKDRHELYKNNYPETECISGDIWNMDDKIIEEYRTTFSNEELFMVYATPPCQGMSSNGAGTLLKGIRSGERPAIDERNRTIIPTMKIVKELKPKWFLMENVPNMLNTIINDENDNYINIIDYVRRELGSEYVGRAEVISCSDYGVPQTRKRLITIFTRDYFGIRYFERFGSFFPPHEKQEQITLRQAIGSFPPLSAEQGKNECKAFNELHFVPIISPHKLWWLDNTPEGETAYNNQCSNPNCGYKENGLHRDVVNDGIAQSNKNTPIYCEICNSLLPRPTMIDKKTGELRLLKGFHSAYRRTEWDRPAHALTQNFIYEASDNKVHPEQNRVLSIYEALVVQTISQYEYDFHINGKLISNSLFAQIIGESVPPRVIDFICNKMINIEQLYGEYSLETGFI